MLTFEMVFFRRINAILIIPTFIWIGCIGGELLKIWYQTFNIKFADFDVDCNCTLAMTYKSYLVKFWQNLCFNCFIANRMGFNPRYKYNHSNKNAQCLKCNVAEKKCSTTTIYTKFLIREFIRYFTYQNKYLQSAFNVVSHNASKEYFCNKFELYPTKNDLQCFFLNSYPGFYDKG